MNFEIEHVYEMAGRRGVYAIEIYQEDGSTSLRYKLLASLDDIESLELQLTDVVKRLYDFRKTIKD